MNAADYTLGWNEAIDACITELTVMKNEDAARLADRVKSLRSSDACPQAWLHAEITKGGCMYCSWRVPGEASMFEGCSDPTKVAEAWLNRMTDAGHIGHWRIAEVIPSLANLLTACRTVGVDMERRRSEAARPKVTYAERRPISFDDEPRPAEATLSFGNTVKSEHCLRYGGPCTGGPDQSCGECSGMTAVHEQKQRRERAKP